jgi:hypothetical protein
VQDRRHGWLARDSGKCSVAEQFEGEMKSGPRLGAMKPRLAQLDTRRLKPAPKVVDAFYHSAAWVALCAAIKRERWPRLLALQGHCCEDPECRAEHSAMTRIFFDHVLERRDRPDLELDRANIMGRCGASHSLKTARARAQRLGTPAESTTG